MGTYTSSRVRPPRTRTNIVIALGTCAHRKTDIRTVSDPIFLEKASENTLEIYQRVMWNVQTRFGPVIEVFEVEGSRERRLVIGYKTEGTKKFFSALSNLYHFYSLYSARKYVGECGLNFDDSDRVVY